MSGKIIWKDETASTNNDAKLLIQQRAIENGDAIVAEKQMEGKGQMNAVWESEAHKNITISFVYDLRFLKPEHIFFWNKSIANAVHQTVVQFVKNETINIKWPNDILINEQKVSGILVENILSSSSFSWSIVGIGININQQVFLQAPNAVSFIQILGKETDKSTVISYLQQCMDNAYALAKQAHWNEIENYYNNYLYKKNEWTFFKANHEIFSGEILFVDENGKLVIQTENGIRKFGLKEISFN